MSSKVKTKRSAKAKRSVVPKGDKHAGRSAAPGKSGRFEAVVTVFARDAAVTPPGAGKGFGARALKANGKIFAMMSSRSEFVVKLPRKRVEELVASAQATYFDAGRGKPMKEWAVVTGGERLWVPLAKEARAYADEERDLA